MNIKQRLNSVELLVSELINMSAVQRLLAYSTIKTILDEIETYVEEHESENLGKGSAGLYIAELYYPLEALVGLDCNGHDEMQNRILFSTGIDKLRSIHCFDIS